jgi:hypothetical protein
MVFSPQTVPAVAQALLRASRSAFFWLFVETWAA